jgi:hypothetical protein
VNLNSDGSGGGFNIGVAGGAGVFGGRTYTSVTPLSGRKDRLFIQMGIAYYTAMLATLGEMAILLML